MLRQTAAFRRLVLIVDGKLDVIDIEGNAVTDRHRQNDRTEKGKKQADRVAKKLKRLTPAIGPEPAQTRMGAVAGRFGDKVGIAMLRLRHFFR